MTVFYTTLFLTFISSLSSRLYGHRKKYIGGAFVIFTMIILIAVAGLRSNIGDTGAYMQGYDGLRNFTGFTAQQKDKGFIVFSLFLYNISTDPQFMIFITALITQLCNIYTLAKFRSLFELQTYMYITSGTYLVTMNGVRQAMVAGILFASVNFIIKNKFIPYLAIVLLLSTVHGSALIMIPIYFIARQEVWSKNTFFIIAISATCLLLFYQIVPIFMGLLGDSHYTEYEKSLMTGGGGASFTRFVVNAVPVLLSYLYRDKLKKLWPKSNIFVNISLINLIIMAFSLYNWIFARFSMYFQLYNFVLLPYIIKHCFTNSKDRDLVYYLFMVCYFIFFYYEQVIGGVGLGYRSNFF